MKLRFLIAVAAAGFAGCAGDGAKDPAPGEATHPDSPETRWSPPPDRLQGPVEAPAREGAGVWTCPMHPEVKSDAPGKCPKCGMALEEAKR